ncbi:MAG: alpha/beta hydrolase [Flavobacteriaceae bacterium]|nr:alpha/beta hydrolase [Flavobacteriaceae bacterium]|tara:strand:- start:27521 stop:28288 length:768 start_codon:yes stop_codon:yes gene_type:complete
MVHNIIEEKEYKYIEEGEGFPIIILHGLMGNLSNFKEVTDFFKSKNFKVIMPVLPIYDLPILKTSVKELAKFLDRFIAHKKIKEFVLMGNSLGGHIGLYYTKIFNKAKGLVLTGSSGLYEKGMGSGYTKRGDYEVIRKKVEEVFFEPAVATKELVDEVFQVVNDRSKLIKILAMAKSAIRHNMAQDLPYMKLPVCVIWGKNDNVTPPEVADEFHKLLPNSDLFWIDKCGHAPMMEHPSVFNNILFKWISSKILSK